MARRKPTPPTAISDRTAVARYAKAVTAGKIIAGPHVRDACARHLRDLETGRARGLRWDTAKVDRVFGYFREVLRLNGGEFESVPFELLGWQAFVLGSIFGWHDADGYRRFRVAYIETGKGSGKSPLLAGVGLYMLASDGEPRAEVYAAATKKDQARVLFRDAIAMVEQSPALSRRLHMAGGQEKHNIAHTASDSFFRPISSEERGVGQSGPRPHCSLLDEIHEHPTNAMVEFLRAGTKSRRQALQLMITNSGSNRQSPCFEYHEYAAKVCRGDLEDDGFFGYVCALDENDDPLNDESCWPKANPSLPVVPGYKYLREQVREAKGLPSKEALVKRLNFCQWVDAENPLFSREVWMAVLHDLVFEHYRGRRCWLAIDLSGKADLTAMAMAFESEIGLDVFVEYWTPKDTLRERALKDRWPYDRWVEDGYMVAVPGKSIDYAWPAQRIAEVCAHHDVQMLGFDRWRIEDLERELDDIGFEHHRWEPDVTGYGLAMCPHGQGFKEMGPAVEAFETSVLNATIRIHHNPVTTMCAANAVITKDPAESRKFDKGKATGRIDGMVAIAMAVRLATAQMEPGGNPYEDDDLMAVELSF